MNRMEVGECLVMSSKDLQYFFNQILLPVEYVTDY
jgi:hypothetical protein